MHIILAVRGSHAESLQIGASLQGYLAHEKHPTRRTLRYACVGPCGDPRGLGVSYERGTPVPLLSSAAGWLCVEEGVTLKPESFFFLKSQSFLE